MKINQINEFKITGNISNDFSRYYELQRAMGTLKELFDSHYPELLDAVDYYMHCTTEPIDPNDIDEEVKICMGIACHQDDMDIEEIIGGTK